MQFSERLFNYNSQDFALALHEKNKAGNIFQATVFSSKKKCFLNMHAIVKDSNMFSLSIIKVRSSLRQKML